MPKLIPILCCVVAVVAWTTVPALACPDLHVGAGVATHPSPTYYAPRSTRPYPSSGYDYAAPAYYSYPRTYYAPGYYGSYGAYGYPGSYYGPRAGVGLGIGIGIR